jgi:hypothetical protein
MHRSKGQEQSRAEQEMQGVNMVRNVRQGIIAKTAYYQCHGAEVHMWKKKRTKNLIKKYHMPAAG